MSLRLLWVINIILSELFLRLILCLIALVDTHRSPFDLSEAESELVSGYNTELIGLIFTLVFLSEYMVIVYFSVLVSFLLRYFFCYSHTGYSFKFSSSSLWHPNVSYVKQHTYFQAYIYDNFLNCKINVKLVYLRVYFFWSKLRRDLLI